MKFASATASALAVELGLDGVQIIGSGRDGRVTVADVRKAAPQRVAPEKLEIPDGMGDDGRVFLEKVVDAYVLGPHEWELALSTARTIDELRAIEARIVTASPTVRGSQGQVRPHPLYAEARQHRVVLARLIAALKIEDEADGHGAAASEAGRQLAKKRHGH